MKPFYFFVAAVTLDGFISHRSGNKVDWTSKEDFAHLQAMEDKADVLVLASTTFKIAQKNLEKKKRNCIVLTTKVNGMEEKNSRLVLLNPKKESLQKFVEQKGYKKVCVLGGRKAYTHCLEHGLVDEIFLTIEPVIFGQGISMFDKPLREQKLKLVSVKKLNKHGTVLLQYRKK